MVGMDLCLDGYKSRKVLGCEMALVLVSSPLPARGTAFPYGWYWWVFLGGWGLVALFLLFFLPVVLYSYDVSFVGFIICEYVC